VTYCKYIKVWLYLWINIKKILKQKEIKRLVALQHLVMISGGRRIPLTLGTFTVDRILAWDQIKATV
jgi:hypothetical protein